MAAARTLLLLLLAATAALLLRLPGGAAAPPAGFAREMVVHRHGIGVSMTSLGAPTGCLLLRVRDLGPSVPGITADLPPTEARLDINQAAPLKLETTGPGELGCVVPLMLLRRLLPNTLRLEVGSAGAVLFTLDLDLLLP